MASSRFTPGIATPIQDLEPSPVLTFFKNHSKKGTWALLALAAISVLITLFTPYPFIAFLGAPALLMLFSATKPYEERRYEVSRQSIADALALPAYLPAGVMTLTWAVLYQPLGSALATLSVLPIPLAFSPFLARQVRNHRKNVWNTMVRRLELAVMEHVPFAEVDIRSNILTGSSKNAYDEAEWETRRRRQAAFDAWLSVDLPLQRKIDLMAGGIGPDRAFDPDVTKMSADDLKTLKAMETLATPAEAR